MLNFTKRYLLAVALVFPCAAVRVWAKQHDGVAYLFVSALAVYVAWKAWTHVMHKDW